MLAIDIIPRLEVIEKRLDKLSEMNTCNENDIVAGVKKRLAEMDVLLNDLSNGLNAYDFADALVKLRVNTKESIYYLNKL